MRLEILHIEMKEKTASAMASGKSMKNEKSLTYVYAPLSSSFMTYLLNHAENRKQIHANTFSDRVLHKNDNKRKSYLLTFDPSMCVRDVSDGDVGHFACRHICVDTFCLNKYV